MNLLERLSHWLRIDPPPTMPPSVLLTQNTLNQAKALKRIGRYDEALAELARAEGDADPNRDSAFLAAIRLHRADIYIAQSRWEEARTLLEQLRCDAEEAGEQPQLAYALVMSGAWAQAQGEWDTARRFYEDSLIPARESQSLGAEGRAQGYLADTYLQEGNASYARYLLEEALPKLDRSGDTELASYFVGRLGEAQIQTGDVIQGQRLLERALYLAEQGQSLRFRLMWRRALAIRLLATGFYVDAKHHLNQILSQDEFPITDADRISALCWMSKTCLRLNEQRAGVDYARQAEEQAAQGDPESDSCILARGALGAALRATGAYSEAISHLAAASPRYDALALTAADYTFIDILSNLAAAQLGTGDLEAAKKVYQQAHDFAQARDLPFEIAHINRDMGLLHLQQGQLEEAIEVWMTALQIYETQHDYGRAARLYCDIANTRRYLGQGQRAMRDYNQALTLLNSVDDRNTRGVVLSNAATAYADQGDIETAESFFIESIQIAEQSQSYLAEATRRGNYGWFLMAVGRPQRALAALKIALRQSEKHDFKLQAAVQINNIGLVHYDIGQYEEALDHYRRALTLLEDLNAPDWVALAQANSGHALAALERWDEAAALFDSALQTGRASRHIELVVHILNGQTRIALGRQDDNAAVALIDEALQLARRADLNRLLADTLELRSRYNAQHGQFDPALEDWEQALKLRKILRRSVDESPPAWLDHRS